MVYVYLFVLFLVLELIYFKIAETFNIIDKPNSRSSHTVVTLRGGGVIFPIAVVVAFFLGYTSWCVTLAVVLVALVSFIDDIKPLRQLPRFVSQTLAVLLVFYDLDLFTNALYLLPILFILIIGWVNAFNFMDGINAITVLYALIAIASFSFLSVNQESLPLLISMGLACVVFGLFNIRRKAKTFAGDVGSISMALFLGFFMIKTIQSTGQWGYLLFFSIYGVDAVITIVTRIMKRENIFEPHRSHLYQYLANELGYSHVLVSVIYSGIQLGINGLIFWLDLNGNLSNGIIFCLLVFIAALYIILRIFVLKKVDSKKSNLLCR
jgi:UDP-N-acetylmuramyl pentapeptide phosphotransferase/UDP-N-acetylglucosamine-1-phosphate transferase